VTLIAVSCLKVNFFIVMVDSMELKKYFFVFITSSISFLSNGQAPVITSQKCFGGTNAEGFNSVNSFGNNGYLLGGGTLSSDGDVTFNHGSGDFWFIKTDSAFDIIWEKCYGGSGGESGQKVLILNNSNFILAGGTASNNGDVSGNHQSGTYDGWLVEIDSSGSMLFQKCYGGSGGDAIQSLIQTYDGGYLMVGSTSSSDGDLLGSGYHGSSDGWILKIDSSKNIEWGKCIGGTWEDGLVDIFTAGNSNYIIGGISYSSDGDVSNNYGGYDFWLIKIDSIGNIIWNKSYGDPRMIF
jgi:hypothetical protein